MDPLLRSGPVADNSYRGGEAGIDSITDEVEGYRRLWLVSLLRQGKVYELDRRQRATVGRVMVGRENFGEFSLELWR